VKIIDEGGVKDPASLGFEIELLVGTMQHATIIKTTRDGRLSRLARGQAAFGGKPPYGYTRVDDPALGGYRLVPDPEKAANLRRVLEWFCACGATRAARLATEAAIPVPREKGIKNRAADWTPTRWDRSTIEKIARRASVYATGTIEGTIYGRPYSLQAEPLISHELRSRVEIRIQTKTLKRPAN
jgi:hypothetical protein